MIYELGNEIIVHFRVKTSQISTNFPVYKGETLIIQGYCLQVSYIRGQQNLTFRHISNALLFTAVHVKMKLGDNTLNNERLLFVGTKFPPKKLANCSPYFNALQDK